MSVNKEPAARRACDGLDLLCLLGGEHQESSPKTVTPQGAARKYRDEARSLTGASAWSALSLANFYSRQLVGGAHG